MNNARFDGYSASYGTRHSRRTLTRLLGGLMLGGPLVVLSRADSEAKGKRRRKRSGRRPAFVLPPSHISNNNADANDTALD